MIDSRTSRAFVRFAMLERIWHWRASRFVHRKGIGYRSAGGGGAREGRAVARAKCAGYPVPIRMQRAWPPGSRTAKRGGCSTDSLREAGLLARGSPIGGREGGRMLVAPLTWCGGLGGCESRRVKRLANGQPVADATVCYFAITRRSAALRSRDGWCRRTVKGGADS